jgi:hypothetical protein
VLIQVETEWHNSPTQAMGLDEHGVRVPSDTAVAEAYHDLVSVGGGLKTPKMDMRVPVVSTEL